MAETPDRGTEAEETSAASALIAADQFPFGPSFFLGHLGRFVRDQCPAPTEDLPVVEVHLCTSETLTVCHIIGVSPRWVVLAVRDTAGHGDRMAIDIVPYSLIQRVSIRTRQADSASIGFSETHAPAIIGAETLLRAALSPHHGPR
ncbi:MAG: hypothetical protein K2Y23_04000 [Cyanobacteria bacterium]|nr:hypothetical protein [Cyanobacteriota bacterium]